VDLVVPSGGIPVAFYRHLSVWKIFNIFAIEKQNPIA
jgi:hypothetical protein